MPPRTDVLHVVGARPNFMKAAPVHRALAALGARQVLVHTGQHYDERMSRVFFGQLGLPRPQLDLQVGSGSHASQTAEVLRRIEPVLLRHRPGWVLVYGDVNSTLAAALASVKLGLPTAHVEAGLRSRDRAMPEEHNRIAADHLADLLFTPSADADANLAAEGIPRSRVRRVGNVMIDTLKRLLPVARALPPLFPGERRPLVLVTLHRPSNVDDPAVLSRILRALESAAREALVVFPMHPRTKARLPRRTLRAVHAVEPLGYLEFLALQDRAALVVTDSGGIQEETTYLGVPCLTVRENTERPITLELGTNELVGCDAGLLRQRILARLGEGRRKGGRPPLWDGRSGERIARILTSRSSRP